MWAAFRFTAPFAEVFLGIIELHSVRLAVAALVLIVSILVLGSMLSWLVGRLLRSTGLTGTDRLLGAVFGALRGLLTVVSLVAVASWTPVCHEPWWRQSQLIPGIEAFALYARDFLPAGLREIIGPPASLSRGARRRDGGGANTRKLVPIPGAVNAPSSPQDLTHVRNHRHCRP